MKKLTISILSLIAIAMLVGIAFADPWETFRNVATSRNSIVIGPGFDFTTSAAGTCTLTNGATIPSGKVLTGDVTGTASRIAVGSFIDTSYGLKNSTSNKAQVNLSADMGLAFDTGARAGAIKVVNGDGIDLGAAGVEVDATDIIDTNEGLYESTANNIAINLTEDGGLGFGTGADNGALIVYPADGIKTTSNGLEVNLSAKSGLAIGTGSEDGALKIGVGVFEMDIVGGGTPGNFTLTGASLGDELMGVTYFNATTGNVTAISDLTSEFNIPASNVLNQTYGGTSSLNGYLQVLWIDRT